MAYEPQYNTHSLKSDVALFWYVLPLALYLSQIFREFSGGCLWVKYPLADSRLRSAGESLCKAASYEYFVIVLWAEVCKSNICHYHYIVKYFCKQKIDTLWLFACSMRANICFSLSYETDMILKFYIYHKNPLWYFHLFCFFTLTILKFCWMFSQSWVGLFGNTDFEWLGNMHNLLNAWSHLLATAWSKQNMPSCL